MPPGSIPYHASAIRAGRGFWGGVREEERQEILDDVDFWNHRDRRPRWLTLYAAPQERNATR